MESPPCARRSSQSINSTASQGPRAHGTCTLGEQTANRHAKKNGCVGVFVLSVRVGLDCQPGTPWVCLFAVRTDNTQYGTRVLEELAQDLAFGWVVWETAQASGGWL